MFVQQTTQPLHCTAAAGSVTLVGLLMLQEQYDTAVHHFQQILDKQPDHYTALSQLVTLLRRAGKLTEASEYLDTMQAKHPLSASVPGEQIDIFKPID